MAMVETGNFRQRSTVQLVEDFTNQASTLVHQEAELIGSSSWKTSSWRRPRWPTRGRKPASVWLR